MLWFNTSAEYLTKDVNDNFNTSYVMVQLLHSVGLRLRISDFNTSYVMVQHGFAVNFLVR